MGGIIPIRRESIIKNEMEGIQRRFMRNQPWMEAAVIAHHYRRQQLDVQASTYNSKCRTGESRNSAQKSPAYPLSDDLTLRKG